MIKLCTAQCRPANDESWMSQRLVHNVSLHLHHTTHCVLRLTYSVASPSAVSAVSALAARRRLAAVASLEGSQPSSPSRGEASGRSSSNANAFSVLQNLSRQGNSESQSASQASTQQDLKKSGRSTPLKRSEAARG